MNANKKLTLMAVGDITLKTSGNTSPFREVEKILSRKDVLFGNLETVLSERGKELQKSTLLHSLPANAAYLKEAGFDVVNIANNHIMDMGKDGLDDTLEALRENRVMFIGAGNQKYHKAYTIIERKGIKLGFLGYDEGGHQTSRNGVFINRIDKHILQDIRRLKTKCDLVIISLHWGIEHVFYPSPKQIAFARMLIDNGASIILGHHPHFVQGIERYKHGLIAYSLGNFQFNTKYFRRTWFNDKADLSFILLVEVSKNNVINHKVFPIKIIETSPQILEGKEREDQIKLMQRISEPIARNMIYEDWWFEQIAASYLFGNMESWMIRIKKYGLMHFFQFFKWLIFPFNLKCYLALLRKEIKRI